MLVRDDISRHGLVGVLLCVSACTCQPSKLNGLEPARLAANPASVLFPATYVGRNLRLATEVGNSGGASSSVELSAPAPFGLQASRLEFAGGQSQTVAIDFAPTSPGHFMGTLKIGSLEIPLQGEGLAVPQCEAAPVCSQSAFDFTAQQCIATPGPDAVSCESRCVIGSCAGGACRGQLKPCEDTDACTVDSCSEAEGCTHTPRKCPAPTDRCKVAACNSASGCSVEDAPDGTLCGPDDCGRPQVEVCIQAQCVLRTRPTTGCTNTWEPLFLTSRAAAGLAFDVGRQRAVLFGGFNGGSPVADTWEWDGATWTQRTTATAPQARSGTVMAYDAARKRVVLFGGFSAASAVLADTWEWDGATWTQLTPAASPPARGASAMVYDSARQRVVLFGGHGVSSYLADTWVWDGTNWSDRTSGTSPPGRLDHAMAYDAQQQRTVLFGGQATGSAYLSDTWLWDGTTWSRPTQTGSPSPRTQHAMAWDASRKRVVLFGGRILTNGPSLAGEDTWEWDGAKWALRTPTRSAPGRAAAAMTYDETRRQILIVGGFDNSKLFADSWVFDGATWSEKTAIAPSSRLGAAIAYDASRQRVVLFGGVGSIYEGDTWEWDGAAWSRRTPLLSPAPRYWASMAFDAVRKRLVLYGGRDMTKVFTDTWEWDGASWVERTPVAGSPGPMSATMAYDAARQKMVLFGGTMTSGETWEWDGSTWARRFPLLSPGSTGGPAMTYDSDRHRVILNGGNSNSNSDKLDAWEWDGTRWTQPTAPSPFPARSRPGLAYDSVRKRTVLFGGTNATVLEIAEYPTETLEWDGAGWTKRTLTVSPSHFGSLAMTYDEARKELLLVNGNGHTSETWRLRP